jgi:transposase-like protein
MRTLGTVGPHRPRLRIRLREGKSCVLVLVGVRADGTKELIATSDGYRESADSWTDLLRDCAGPPG